MTNIACINKILQTFSMQKTSFTFYHKQLFISLKNDLIVFFHLSILPFTISFKKHHYTFKKHDCIFQKP